MTAFDTWQATRGPQDPRGDTCSAIVSWASLATPAVAKIKSGTLQIGLRENDVEGKGHRLYAADDATAIALKIGDFEGREPVCAAKAHLFGVRK